MELPSEMSKEIDKRIRKWGFWNSVLIIIILVLGFVGTNIFLSDKMDNYMNKDFEMWSLKKETYLKAILILDQLWDSGDFKGPNGDHVPIVPPSSQEINEVALNLLFLSDNPEIPQKFLDNTRFSNPSTINEFIVLVRKDLKGSDLNFNNISLKYNTDPNLSKYR